MKMTSQKIMTALILALTVGFASSAWATTVDVSTYAQLKAAIQDTSVDVINVAANIDVPCGKSASSAMTETTTAALSVFGSRNLLIQGKDAHVYTIKRTGSTSADNHRSILEIYGTGTYDGMSVSLKNIVFDGGAVWDSDSTPETRWKNRGKKYSHDYYGKSSKNTGISGRSVIDVANKGTLNLESGAVVQNGDCACNAHTRASDIDTDAYTYCYGGCIRVECHNSNGGGTINIKSGAVVQDGAGGEGGGVGSYNLSRLNIYGGTIRRCAAELGGGVGVTWGSTAYGTSGTETHSGVISCSGGVFEDCWAFKKGAALAIEGTAKNCEGDDYYKYSRVLGMTAKNCVAADVGAALAVLDPDNTTVYLSPSPAVKAVDCTGTGNYTKQDYKAADCIYVESGATITPITSIHTLTFIDGADLYGQVDVEQGRTAGPMFPADPARTGMVFTEWRTNLLDSTSKITKDTVINADVTAYAYWVSVQVKLDSATVPNTTYQVFLKDSPITPDSTGKYYVPSNEQNIVVVYTADANYYFAGDTTAATNQVITSTNPATVQTPLPVASQHKHCICGTGTCAVGGHAHDHTVVWTGWTSTTSLPTTAGNWFLLNDVTLTAEYVPVTGVNLCLNGHTVTQTTSGKRVINVSNSGTSELVFSLTDCAQIGKITGGTITGGQNYGAGVNVKKTSSGKSIFNYYGGIICGNTATSVADVGSGCGGGVCVDNACEFYMYGGAISNNTATSIDNYSGTGRGGGLFVSDTGKAFVYGGDICYNTANRYGGGVEIGSDGTKTPTMTFGGTARVFGNTGGCAGGICCDSGSLLTVIGGEIFGNNANKGKLTNGDAGKGGGLYLYDGPHSISHCVIYNNSASVHGGGVCHEAGQTVTFGGALVVTNNTVGGTLENVYFSSGKTVALSSLASDSKIGVTLQTAPATKGAKTAFTTNGSSSDTAYFFSDNATYNVVYDTDHLALAYPLGIQYVEVKEPSPLPAHTTFKVFTNGVEVAKTGGKYLVVSNSADVAVVYRADDDYFFADGTTAKTNTLTAAQTSTNPATLPAAPDAPTQHKHCICGTGTCAAGGHAHADIVWTPWTSTTMLPTTAGNWYLVNDVNLVDAQKLAANVNLCLNGKIVKQTTDGLGASAPATEIVAVPSGKIFTLTDCGTEKRYFTDTDGDGWYRAFSSTPSAGALATTGGCLTGYHGHRGALDVQGTCVMYAGNVVGNCSTNNVYDGYGTGGVNVRGSASRFDMYGGAILGNLGHRGGGVSVAFEGAQATLNGGLVGFNYAIGWGGGVYCSKQAKVEIAGVKIIGNTALSGGGGVGINGTGSKVEMISGAIDRNCATNSCGGGVSMGEGTFVMTGGTVIGNYIPVGGEPYGAGIFHFGSGVGQLELGGTACVTGNVFRGVEQNVYLANWGANDARILVSTNVPFAAGAKIGLSCYRSPKAYAPILVTYNGAAGDAAFFTSDLPAYEVRFEGSCLVLAVPDVTFTPDAVSRTTATVLTNGVAMDVSSSYTIPSNATPVVVVYTADSGCYFDDGSTVKTNTVTTSKDPAEMSGLLPPAPTPAVKYVAPVYKGTDNNPTNGIARWVTNTVYGSIAVMPSTSVVEWGTAGVTNWYVVTNNVEISGGITCLGYVNLILCDGARLTVTGDDYVAGIAATDPDDDGSYFTVYAQEDGTGELEVSGGEKAAAIGGNKNADGRNITLNGGIVTAFGGSEAAAIGGGYSGDGVNLVINGGTVKAIAGDNCAAIGGDHSGVAEGVVINGGTIAVLGNQNSDLIGSGKGHNKSSDILIAPTANILFSVCGETDPLPTDFEGFVVMTPMTQSVDRILVTGFDDSTTWNTFSLTNLETGATGSLAVNGGDCYFAARFLSITNDDSKLVLKSVDAVEVIPEELTNATYKVYRGNEELSTAPYRVPIGATPVKIVYEPNTGYIFPDGSTAKTNVLDSAATQNNPASPLPAKPAAPVLCVVKVTQDSSTTYYESLAPAFDAIGVGGTGTVTMLRDLTLAETGAAWVPDDADVTFDLNGKKIDWTTSDGDALIYFAEGTDGKLTIKDSATGGMISSTCTSSEVTNSAIIVYSCGDGDLTVDGGTFVCSNEIGAATLFFKDGNGDWAFSNGTYKVVSAGAGNADFLYCRAAFGTTVIAGGDFDIKAAHALASGVGASAAGLEKVTITGGDFDIVSAGEWYGAFTAGNGTLVAKGGDFHVVSTGAGVSCFAAERNGTTIISNGTFYAESTGAYAYAASACATGNLVIAGGTLSAKAAAETCATVIGKENATVTITGAPTLVLPTGTTWNLIVQTIGAHLDFTGYTGADIAQFAVFKDATYGESYVKGDMAQVVNGTIFDGYFSTRPTNSWVQGGKYPLHNTNAATKVAYPWVIGIVVTYTPPVIPNTTATVYTNGAPMEAANPYILPTNVTDVTVVYTADPGSTFPDGTTAKTNDVDTSTQPATTRGTLPSAPFAPVASVMLGGVTTFYSDINDAWERAISGTALLPSTLKLLADIALTNMLEVSSDGIYMTIDFNDHVLSSAITEEDSLHNKMIYFDSKSGQFDIVDLAAVKTKKYFTETTSGLWVLTNEVTALFVEGGTITGAKSNTAVWVSRVTGDIRDVAFVGNHTDGDGAALYLSGDSSNDSRYNIYNARFYGNVAEGSGGAICVWKNGQFLMKDCDVRHNVAGSNGGGIFVYNKCVLLDTTIIDNTAADSGAGLYFEKSGSCLAAGTKILMADGTEKAIEEIAEGDLVATFNHEGGTNASARIYLAYEGPEKARPFTLAFDNGAKLSIVDLHDLLEETSRKYVRITEANAASFIGKRFYGRDGAWHTLSGVTFAAEPVAYYSIYSAQHQNVYANGLLTVADDADFILNIYELVANLKADQAQLTADVSTYGLVTPEYAMSKYGMDRPYFDDARAKYLFVAIGKGLVTLDELVSAYQTTGGGASASPAPVFASAPLMVGAPLLGAMPPEPMLDDFASFGGGVLVLGKNAVVTNNFVGAITNSNIHLASAASRIALADDHTGVIAGVTRFMAPGQITTTNDLTTASDVVYLPSDDAAYVTRFSTNKYLRLALLSTVTPESVEHTTFTIYTNGVPITEDTITLPDDIPVEIVYTPEDGYIFPDGTTAKTNDVDVTVNPAMVLGDLPSAGAFIITNQTTLTQAIGLLTNGCTEAWYIAKDFNLEKENVIDLKGASLTIFGAEHTIAATNGQISAFALVGTNGAFSVTFTNELTLADSRAPLACATDPLIVSNGVENVKGLEEMGLGYIELLNGKGWSYLVQYTPTPIKHVKYRVYSAGYEIPGSPYLVPSNGAPVYVVYSLEDGYTFDDGTDTRTNELETTTNPATLKGTLPNPGAFVITNQTTLTEAIGLLTNGCTEAWYIADGFDLTAENVIDFKDVTLTVLGANHTLTTTVDRTSAFTLVGTNGALSVAFAAGLKLVDNRKPETIATDPLIVSNGTVTATGLDTMGLGYIELLNGKGWSYLVEFTPTPVEHTTHKVYAAGKEIPGEPYLVPRDGAPVYVVYTPDDGYTFDDGSDSKTNDIDTTTSPATMQGDLPSSGAFVITNQTTLTQAIGLLTNGCTEAWYIAKDFNLETANVIDLAGSSLTIFGAGRTIAATNGQISAFVLVGTNGAFSVTFTNEFTLADTRAAETIATDPLIVSNGVVTATGLDEMGLGYIELLNGKGWSYLVTFTPTPVEHTTHKVYAAGYEIPGEPYLVPSNGAPVYVVYTPEDGYTFDDGTDSKTNAIETSTNPATQDLDDLPKPGAFAITNQTTLTQAIGLLTNGCTEAWYIADDFNLEKENVIDLKDASLTIFGAAHTIAATNGQISAFVLVGTNGAFSVTFTNELTLADTRAPETCATDPLIVSNGVENVKGLDEMGLGYIELLNGKGWSYLVTFTPTPVEHTTHKVYAAGYEIPGEPYLVPSNGAPVYVVYTPDDGYTFDDGTDSKTNAIETSTNPATQDLDDLPKPGAFAITNQTTLTQAIGLLTNGCTEAWYIADDFNLEKENVIDLKDASLTIFGAAHTIAATNGQISAFVLVGTNGAFSVTFTNELTLADTRAPETCATDPLIVSNGVENVKGLDEMGLGYIELLNGKGWSYLVEFTPTPVEHTTHKVYAAGYEIPGEPYLVPSNGAPVYVVYTPDDGYTFDDGTDSKTNAIETSTNPATQNLDDLPTSGAFAITNQTTLTQAINLLTNGCTEAWYIADNFNLEKENVIDLKDASLTIFGAGRTIAATNGQISAFVLVGTNGAFSVTFTNELTLVDERAPLTIATDPFIVSNGVENVKGLDEMGLGYIELLNGKGWSYLVEFTPTPVEHTTHKVYAAGYEIPGPAPYLVPSNGAPVYVVYTPDDGYTFDDGTDSKTNAIETSTNPATQNLDDLPTPGAFAITNQTTLTQAIGLLTNGCTEAWYIADDFNLEKENVIDLKDASLTIFGAEHTIAATNGQISAFVLVGTNGAFSVTFTNELTLVDERAPLTIATDPLIVSNGVENVKGLDEMGLGYIELLNGKGWSYLVEFTPTPVEHTTHKVYAAGYEIPGEPYLVPSNGAPVYVVYTTEDSYVFPDGTTLVTNEVDTSTDPAGASYPDEPIAWITLAYDAMGGAWFDGTEVSNITTRIVDGYNLPDAPVRTDYAFLGWFDAGTNGAAQVTNGQPIVRYRDHRLVAKWESTKIEPGHGGDVIDAEIINENSAIILGPKSVGSVPPDLVFPEMTSNGPDGVPFTVVQSNAFLKLQTIRSVALPLYVTNVRQRAFLNCRNLKKITFVEPRDYLTLEKRPLVIGDYAFAGLGITDLVIPADISSVGEFAFAACPYLTNIVIKGTFEKKGEYPFNNCAYYRKDVGVTIHLAPAAATNATFVTWLTNGCTKVKIAQQLDGQIEATAIDVTTEPGFALVSFAYTGSGIVNERTLSALYQSNDDPSVRSVLTPLEITPGAEAGTYMAKFALSGTGFIWICIEEDL